ncbi:MAG TPA: hypothetical protein VNJ29_00310, partial [Candidatus Nitrosotenuis sp.]|nr:hypothetical protein [Candidatus Nitrosotenuis sp.]
MSISNLNRAVFISSVLAALIVHPLDTLKAGDKDTHHRHIPKLPEYLLEDLKEIEVLREKIDKDMSKSHGFFEDLYENINREVDELIHTLYRAHYQKNEARFIKEVIEKIGDYIKKESRLTEQDKNKLVKYIKMERFNFLDFKRQLILYKVLEKSVKGTKFFFDQASYGELKELSK